MIRLKVLLPLLGLELGVFLIFATGNEDRFLPFLVWPAFFFVCTFGLASWLENLGVVRLWLFIAYPVGALVWGGLALILAHFAQMCGLLNSSVLDFFVSWKDVDAALVVLTAILFSLGLAREIARFPKTPLART